MSMSTSTITARCARPLLAVIVLAPWLAAVPVAAQEGARPDGSTAGGAAKFDQQECLRAADRFGAALLDPVAGALRPDASRKELEAASAKLKDTLRDACAAAGLLASDEARAAADKMAAAAREAARQMGDALDGFYRSLPDEQKRKLDALGRRFALDDLLKGLSDWLAPRDRPGGADGVPGDKGTARSLGRVCIVDRCFDIPGEFDFGRSDRGRDR